MARKLEICQGEGKDLPEHNLFFVRQRIIKCITSETETEMMVVLAEM
jgi:hypothetical protein